MLSGDAEGHADGYNIIRRECQEVRRNRYVAVGGEGPDRRGEVGEASQAAQEDTLMCLKG